MNIHYIKLKCKKIRISYFTFFKYLLNKKINHKFLKKYKIFIIQLVVPQRGIIILLHKQNTEKETFYKKQ